MPYSKSGNISKGRKRWLSPSRSFIRLRRFLKSSVSAFRGFSRCLRNGTYRKPKKHYDKWIIVYRHFERFVNGKCSFGDVTIELCNKFREYLLSAKQLRHPKLTITRNSAAGYWSTFRALLKEAYKERLLKENLNDFIEDIEYEEVKKNFLTADEVKLLAATSCEKPILKAASLFSILTGLRISDILKLRWEDIRPDADGEMAMFIRIQKTQKESIHPLSPDMLALCGERDKGIVFKGFNRSMTQEPLKKWLKAAGITKRITFHRFRDTFATLQLAAGSDIYTVSKMLASCHTTPHPHTPPTANGKSASSPATTTSTTNNPVHNSQYSATYFLGTLCKIDKSDLRILRQNMVCIQQISHLPIM